MSVISTSIAGVASGLAGPGPNTAAAPNSASPAAAANTQAIVRGEPAVFVAISVDAEKRVASYGAGRSVDSGSAKKNVDAKKQSGSTRSSGSETRPKVDTSA